MAGEIFERLPSVVQNESVQKEIEYTYVSGQDVYEIKLGPAISIEEVRVGNNVFDEGTDYALNTDGDGLVTEIDWSVGGLSPNDGETFNILQKYETVLSRYIEEHEAEFESLDADFVTAASSFQIDNASGQELDEIGKLFGALGRRAGRGDQDYRVFLKSIVQSFSGRGTKNGVIFAVAAGLATSTDNVSIYEHFNDNPSNVEEYMEYTIVFDDWDPHSGSTIEELAELADASMSRLRKTTYNESDEMSATDAATFTEGQQLSDEMSVDDASVQTTDAAGNMVWDQNDWDFDEWG